MAQLLKRVQPGDIITSDMWNLVVDAINELLQASQTTGIQIESLSPSGAATDPIRVGTLLQINGQSFGYSVGQTSVSFEAQFGRAIVAHEGLLAGSSDTRLLLIAPGIPGLPQAGGSMVLRVSNGIADDTRAVFVQPVTIDLKGSVQVKWRADVESNPEPNPLIPGRPAVFAYQLVSSTNVPATFQLRAEAFTSVKLPAGFEQSIQFFDRSKGDVELPDGSIGLGKNETRNVSIVIPELPAELRAQKFVLHVSASAGQVTDVDSRGFVVGSRIIQPDPDIGIKVAKAISIAPPISPDVPEKSAFLDGSSIKLKAGWRLDVVFEVDFAPTAQGTYDVTVESTGDPLKGWQVALVDTPDTIDVRKGLRSAVRAAITGSRDAEPDAAFQLRINRQDSEAAQTKEFELQLLR